MKIPCIVSVKSFVYLVLHNQLILCYSSVRYVWKYEQENTLPHTYATPTFAGTVTLCTLCLSIAYEVFHNHVLGKHLVNSFNWLWRGFFSFPEGALMKSLIRKPLSHQLPQVFEKYLMLTFNHFTLFAW